MCIYIYVAIITKEKKAISLKMSQGLDEVGRVNMGRVGEREERKMINSFLIKFFNLKVQIFRYALKSEK